MKYDLKEIGKKIRKERKIRNWTQEDFAERLGMSCESRRTICDWENGKKLPHIEHLISMCKLFNCELGYLLCEPQYQYKTKRSSFIGEQLNLSETSVNKLLRFSKDDTIKILDKLIQHIEFEDFLRSIQLHVMNYNEDYFWSDKESIANISKTLNCKPEETEEYFKKSSEAVMSSKLIDIVDCIYMSKDNIYKEKSNLYKPFEMIFK